MLTRIAEQWALTLVTLFFLTGGCDDPPEERQVRAALFVGAIYLLYQEQRRIRRVFEVLAERLRRAGLEARKPWSQRSFTFWKALLLYVGWGGALAEFSTTLHRLFERSGDEVFPKLFALGFFAAVWASATWMWGSLFMDRVSLWRRTASAWRAERAELKRAEAEAKHRAEAARLAGEEGPEPPPPLRPSTVPLKTPPEVMPTYVALSAGVALLFALLGFRAGFQVAGAAADLTARVVVSALESEPDGEVELLLELGEDDTIGEVLPTLLGHGVWPRLAFPAVSAQENADLAATWVLRVDLTTAPRLIQALQADPENVDRIELNAAVDLDPSAAAERCVAGGASLPVNDPLASAQRALQSIGADGALSALRSGSVPRKVRVGVVDSGVDGRHEDLRGVLPFWSHSGDPRGHGTQVAGALAGLADNGRGIASLNVKGRLIELVSYPALYRRGATAEDIVDAIWEAIEDEVRVLNLSFSSPLDGGRAPYVVQEAIEEALAHGVIVVASAGNTRARDASEVWPASLPGVIAVASSDARGRLSAGSSTVSGARRAVMAPGEGVCTTSAGGGYGAVTGTSFAAPMVSGALALAVAICPDLDADEAWRLLDASDASRGYGAPVRLRVDQVLGHLSRVGCP